VLDESSRLDRLIRDLFELARLEAGASPLVKERLDWAAMCRNTIQRFGSRFRDAGIGLTWGGSAEEAWIEADGHRLEEVLDNLLVNALRYVPTGGSVELGLEALGDGERYRLTVRDDGPGIADEELPLVFERFFRAAGAREHAGSGLGLAIVREIVTRHGGTVRAERREPHGLAMVVELPARG
jgi:two-component system sensor histidine kinase BaeS